jgi:rod shape-determining protein MreC
MLFLVVLSITLMALDTRVAAVSRVRQALSVTLLPLQYVVSEPIKLVAKINTMVSSHDSLVQENIDLKAQQLLLKAQVQRLLAIESENNQLKALMQSSTQVQGKVLIAQLLSVDSDPFIHQVLLDKGSREGVFIGQPVLDSNGVLGKIIQVSPFSSRVLLINDPHSGLPIQVTRNGVRAIAMGDGYTGKLRVVNVTQTTDIKKGDMLVTSGLGDQFPEGYPVGVVSSVVKDPGLQFATINVEPSAHLDRARQVLLVWPNRSVPPIKIPFARPKNGVAKQDKALIGKELDKNLAKNADKKRKAEFVQNKIKKPQQTTMGVNASHV